MAIEQKPFVPYTEKKIDTFTVRMNAEERAKLDEMKKLLNVEQDSKCLKIMAWAGRNVIFQGFDKKILKYLCSSERKRLSDFVDIDK